MGKWDNKSNNEILIELKEMQHEHERLKNEILERLDRLDELEKDFHEGNEIISKRMKGSIE